MYVIVCVVEAQVGRAVECIEPPDTQRARRWNLGMHRPQLPSDSEWSLERAALASLSVLDATGLREMIDGRRTAMAHGCLPIKPSVY